MYSIDFSNLLSINRNDDDKKKSIIVNYGYGSISRYRNIEILRYGSDYWDATNRCSTFERIIGNLWST